MADLMIRDHVSRGHDRRSQRGRGCWLRRPTAYALYRAPRLTFERVRLAALTRPPRAYGLASCRVKFGGLIHAGST